MPDTPTPLSAAEREAVYRRNFGFFLTDSILFNLGLGLVGANTVIPDFVRHLTSSEVIIGLSGSLFMVGWLLPQLLVARYVGRWARKKWLFVGPNMVVRWVLLVLGGLVVWLGPTRPGPMLLAFFVCYGIAAFGDGLVGIPWADLAGTSLNNRWRARMFGLATAVAGVSMLLIAPLIGLVLGPRGPGFPYNYATLFAASGAVFVVSMLPGLFFRELPGAPATPVPALRDFARMLVHGLRADGALRAFVLIRVCASLFLMAAPFYVGFATVELGLSSSVAVPVLLAMQTIGAVTGALLYAWLGARSNTHYIRLALAGAAVLPVCALLAAWLGPLPLYLGFLVGGLFTENLLSAFLNWVVGYGSPAQRPLFVGLTNTVAAAVALGAPFIAGTLAQTLGYRALFAVALLMALLALYIAARYLRDPEAYPHPEPAAASEGILTDIAPESPESLESPAL
ncbi:MAG: MFS transporter [Anaerolineales bacterium]|nr:MFS transporter [Anaerolineales bacterium]